MFMSRQTEKTPKTKFRKNQPEEIVDKQRKKQNQKEKEIERHGYDMWSDDGDAGC